MKVLLVNDYATPTAGAEKVTLHLRDELVARGHEVRVFASRAQLISGESFADSSCFGTTSRLQTLTSAWNPSALRALSRELKAFSPDVVQVQMFLWQLSPMILRLLKSRRSVYWAGTYKSICPTGLKWLPDGRNCDERAGIACLRNRCITATGALPLLMQQRSWRRQRHAFQAIVPCSHAVARLLEQDGIEVAPVIWPGVLQSASEPQPSPTPVVSYAGRLSHEKGVDILIRAFAAAQLADTGAQLRIAGVGPQQESLRQLTYELSISECVKFLGQLNDAGIDSLLTSTWLHAVPSRWPEPFGMTTTEAMMRGAPVVASDTGGLTESIVPGITGFHVPQGDIGALASVLRSALKDRNTLRAMGEQGRSRALQHFAVRVMVDRFLDLYQSLENGTKGASLQGHIH